MKNLKSALLLTGCLFYANTSFGQTTTTSTATNNKDEDNGTVTHAHTDDSGNSIMVTHNKSEKSEENNTKAAENNDFLKLVLNPTATELTVNLDYKSTNCTSISVTNLTGGTVMETCIFDASSTVLDVSKLKSGTYNLSAEGEKGIAVQTFKKQ